MSSFELEPEPVTERRRPGGTRILLVVLLAVGCVYLALIYSRVALGPGDDAAAGMHPAVGQRLAYLNLQPLTGDSAEVTLDELRGHVVLVNFWGTWCPPCRLEFPHLAALAGTLKNEPNFRLLAVSCGGGADERIDELRAATEAYLEREHSRLPTYADRDAQTRRSLPPEIQESFGYPLTLLLDGDARIRGVWVGYLDGYTEQMERSIERLLRPDKK